MADSEALKGIAMTLRVIAKRPDPMESARTLRVLARQLEEMAEAGEVRSYETPDIDGVQPQ